MTAAFLKFYFYWKGNYTQGKHPVLTSFPKLGISEALRRRPLLSQTRGWDVNRHTGLLLHGA